MAYTALYRKFRPDSFLDVKGQDHIVTTLKNQIKNNRIGHAYLFCGTRGTGKTSIAKIFSKAVNCENLIDGSPCNECESCKSISKGTSMNVIEIDAASNNGVDNIREIRDEVQYPPTLGKYKVYIIDEVHMLSVGAFNALLKTLEEPPAYVIFILATTEVHKIPITILSRCQRYDFKRITIETIKDRLNELVIAENIDAEDEALLYIAKAADGSLRDGVSLLDQCIAFYIGEKLTKDNVMEVLGSVDTAIFSDLLRKIIKADTAGAILLLEDVIMSGRDLSQFVVDFTWYLRNLLLVMSSENNEKIIDLTKERLLALKEEAKMTDSETLMRYIRILSELSNSLRYSSSKRVLLEVAIVKLTRPSIENNMEGIFNRLKLIEDKIENGDINISMPIQNVDNDKKIEALKESEPQKKEVQIAVMEDVKKVVLEWKKIEKGLSGLISNGLKDAKFLTSGGNKLTLMFNSSVTYGIISKADTIKEIEAEILKVIGKEVIVEAKLKEASKNEENNFVEVLNKIQNVEIVEEDF